MSAGPSRSEPAGASDRVGSGRPDLDPPRGGEPPATADALRADVARRLARREPRRVATGSIGSRAAVVLLLRLPGSVSSLDQLEGLFVQRAETAGDPWSGHMALPGGRNDPKDTDLAATALRELEEETGLVLERSALLGRLDDVHPRSRRLPSIAVTPFVGWAGQPAAVVENAELAGHVWVPVGALRSPEHRSTLRLERGGVLRVFPTIEWEGRTIWGLTFRIVREFLERSARAGAGRG